MDRLIAHLSARYGDVLHRRHYRAAGRHLDQVHRADLTRGDDPLQFGVVAVETAVEVDHRDDAAGVGVLHDVDGAG